MNYIKTLFPLLLFTILIGPFQWSSKYEITNSKNSFQPSFLFSTQNKISSPVSIHGNDNFSIKATLETWPGNGSSSNPYILDKITITYYYGLPMIDIRNTDVYFLITNTVLNWGDTGIYFENVTNAKVINTSITNNYYGMVIWESHDNSFINNTVSNSIDEGIALVKSPNNVLTGNRIISNGKHGLSLFFSGNSTVDGNHVQNNEEIGIYIEEARNNNIKNNILINNSFQVWRYIAPFALSSLENFASQTIFNNSVNGKLLVYWVNQHDKTVPRGAGQVFIVNSTSITIMNQEFCNNSGGLVVAFSSNITIQNNSFTQAARIHLQDTINSTITHNTIINSRDEGISLFNSEKSTLSSNTVLYSKNDGIYLSVSGNSTISDNRVSNNWDGVHLYDSDNSILTRNNVSNNIDDGIHLYNTDNTVLSNNTIAANAEYGIYINHYSENNQIQNNTIYENNFGSTQAGDDGMDNVFIFNYWGDWTSPDRNNDGIVDKPYLIDGIANNTDFYPVESPHSPIKDINTDQTPGWTIMMMFLGLIGIVLGMRFKSKE